MSGVLRKSRLEADHESFTLDANGETARRVTDDVTHSKLDAVIEALDGSPINNTTTTIFNIPVATSNTEFSQTLPSNTKRFILKARGSSRVQIAFTTGQTNVTFITIPPGAVYTDHNFYSSKTIYFETSKNGETIEIIAYT